MDIALKNWVWIKKAVRCEQVKEHLVSVKMGKSEVRWKTDMTVKQEHAHCMCLVCGEKLAVYDARAGKKQTDYINDTVVCRYEDEPEQP